MHPATLEGFFTELEKIAQEPVGDIQERATKKSDTKPWVKVLKGAAVAAGAVGAGMAGKHYAKKGLAAVRNEIRDAVHEGVRSGTKGAFWNAFKRS